MPYNGAIPAANFLGRVVGCTSAPVLNEEANGCIFRYEGSGNINVTIPASLPEGFNCGFIMYGTGTITLVPGTGVTNRSTKTALTTQYQNGALLVSKLLSPTTLEFVVGGDFA